MRKLERFILFRRFWYKEIELGRRRVVKYFGNHLLGDYLTEEQAKVLLKLQKVSEGQGGIEELRNLIYELTDEQIEEVISHRTGDIIPEEDRALGTLSDLQTVGVSFMYVAKRLILGDSVGMGKTVQVAALINYLSQEYDKMGYSFNVLYLTEKNLIKQSSKELMKFSGLYFHTLEGEKGKIAKFKQEFDLMNVNICGSHSLMKHPDFHNWCNMYESHYGEGSFPFDMVIIDESGAVLTNEKTSYFESGKLLADKAQYVICMNAGAFENHLDKFRAQIEFVDPTLLFTKTEFQQRYHIMDWYGGRPRFSGKYKNAEDFREKIALRYLKRTRKGQGAKMIDCTAELVEVQASKIQKEFLKKSAMPQMVLDCPPYFDSTVPFNEITVPKAGALLDLLKGKLANVGQVLVYTTLKEPHNYLKDFLLSKGIHAEIMNGSTPLNERNEIIDAFKRGDVRVLITNVQRGLNFGKCNHCVFYNYDGNPNNMVQFEGRITRDFDIINKHVYMIVTKGTEKQKLLSEISRRANASKEFAGSDFSMVLDLLAEHQL
jgi:SWF/SNF family helicase